MKAFPSVICPHCKTTEHMDQVLTAQSNQNVIYRCESCGFSLKNIPTKKDSRQTNRSIFGADQK